MKPKSEDNIAGHQYRWMRAMRDFHAAEKRRVAAEKKAGLKPRPTRLKEADFVFVTDLTEFMQGRLECFRSAAALARACGYSESAADAGLRRLVAAGFLEKMAPAEGDSNGKGRPATRYRVPAIFPVLETGKSTEVFPSCEGENGATKTAFFPSGEGILFPSPEGNDQRDDQKGAGAPSAPPPPSSSDTDVDLIERVGPVAHERDIPPLPSEGPQEGDEPILAPIDRDLPEIPEDVVERCRQADEHAPPPEVRYPVDVEEMLDEVASLIDGDAIEFFNLWEDAFICGDEKSATFVSGILGRAAKKTTRAFVDYPEAVGKFLVDPLSNCLANLAERRGNDPSAVDAAISDFLAAVLVLPQVQAQSLGVNHG